MSDYQGWERVRKTKKLQNYHHKWIPKKDGQRLVEVPKELLKQCKNGFKIFSNKNMNLTLQLVLMSKIKAFLILFQLTAINTQFLKWISKIFLKYKILLGSALFRFTRVFIQGCLFSHWTMYKFRPPIKLL